MYQTFSFVASQHQQNQYQKHLQNLDNEQSMHIFQNSQIAQMQAMKPKTSPHMKLQNAYNIDNID